MALRIKNIGRWRRKCACQLRITENLSGAKYAAKQGDSYELKIIFAGTPPVIKISAETVSGVNSGVLTLRPSASGSTGTITAAISAASITEISIPASVKYDDGTSPAAPVSPPALTPVIDKDVYIAAYWKNGAETILPLSSGVTFAYANAIFVVE